MPQASSRTIVISGGAASGAAFLTDMDSATLRWCSEHRGLMKWLRLAEDNMSYGRVVLYAREGRFRAADLCPRDREEFDDINP